MNHTLPTQRFVTLDVFRGMTVFLMIVVNTQGGGAVPYAQLMHADWNGFTLTDLVFPSFLFAVGNAMVFANQKFAVLPNRTVLYKILRRTILIFIIGYLLAWYPFIGWNAKGDIWIKPFSETRVMAVLQRIALCYGIAALMVRYLKMRTIIMWSILLLLGYWALLYYGGNDTAQFSIEGNVVRKLDLLVFGEQHMYKERGIVFDPEGILSTIPAVVNVLAGYITGWFMLRKGKTCQCIKWLLAIGILLVLLSLLWNNYLPINKKLWTSSYVLIVTGINVIVIAVLFYLLEIKQIKNGVYFFNVFGKNPLFIYVLSNLLGALLGVYVTHELNVIDWLNIKIFQPLAPGPLGCLLFSLFFTIICWSIGWVMDKRKIYVRI